MRKPYKCYATTESQVLKECKNAYFSDETMGFFNGVLHKVYRYGVFVDSIRENDHLPRRYYVKQLGPDDMVSPLCGIECESLSDAFRLARQICASIDALQGNLGLVESWISEVPPVHIGPFDSIYMVDIESCRGTGLGDSSVYEVARSREPGDDTLRHKGFIFAFTPVQEVVR